MLSKTLILIFFVLYFFSDLSYGQKDEKIFRLDYSYIESEESFYKVHMTAQTFADAKRMCAHEGASLFYAEDVDEANAVISFWNKTHPDIPWLWVGLSDIMAEGFFETVDGRPITEVYSRWYRFQPENGSANEDCVHMDLQRTMNDYFCDSKSYFICKKSFQLPVSNSNCTLAYLDAAGHINQEPFREDYNFIKAVQSFYKMHTTSKNWRDAKRVCAEEGASLFYPENKDEANAVIAFWKLHQNNTQPTYNTWVYVGISDIITEGEFETIDGKSISEVYNNWSHNQPDNSGDEDCLHLNQEGELNDTMCDAEYSFICKKTPPLPERDYSCDLQQSNFDRQREKKVFRKDYTYIESEESFYKVHTTSRTFADAKRMCALEGAILFYAEDVDEANAVISYWNGTQPNIPWVFVGLSDINSEGCFETVDGRPINAVYSKWYPLQPENEGGNEGCVHMDLQRTMNDYLCDSKANFICKKSLQSLEWNYDCNIPNLDYTFNKDIGKCYKLHTTPLNWVDAYATCRIEYGSLAMISNRIEAEYLAKLPRSTPQLRINEQYQRGIYHLGFHNRFKEGWQTVRGTPLKVEADTWFDNYQPDGNLHEECGSMFFNGRLINTDCNMKSLFICEHDVDC